MERLRSLTSAALRCVVHEPWRVRASRSRLLARVRTRAPAAAATPPAPRPDRRRRRTGEVRRRSRAPPRSSSSRAPRSRARTIVTVFKVKNTSRRGAIVGFRVDQSFGTTGSASRSAASTGRSCRILPRRSNRKSRSGRRDNGSLQPEPGACSRHAERQGRAQEVGRKAFDRRQRSNLRWPRSQGSCAHYNARMTAINDLRFPTGKLHLRPRRHAANARGSIDAIRTTPAALRAAVAGADRAQLDTPYREGRLDRASGRPPRAREPHERVRPLQAGADGRQPDDQAVQRGRVGEADRRDARRLRAR